MVAVSESEESYSAVGTRRYSLTLTQLTSPFERDCGDLQDNCDVEAGREEGRV